MVIPIAAAPPSVTQLSPTMTVSDGATPSDAQAERKMEGSGLQTP